MDQGVYLPYQIELMRAIDENDVVVVEKSRRTGYSWAMGAVAALTAGLRKSEGGMNAYYVSYDHETTRDFIGYCGDWAKAFSKGDIEFQEELFPDPDDPEKSIQVFRAEFASGFSIVALPSVARALRGKQGLVIIDEAAFHDDLEALLKAAFALLVWGGKVVIISTHNGDENKFNELVQDIRAKKKNYKLLRCTFDDALKQGLYRRICAKSHKEWSKEAEEVWKQSIYDAYGNDADEELDCVPSRGSGVFLPLALVERQRMDVPIVRLTLPDTFLWKPEDEQAQEIDAWCRENLDPVLALCNPDLMSFFGQDFARSGDLSVLWPVQLHANLTRRPPFVLEMKNVPFEAQKTIVIYCVSRLPRFIAGALDATGNGASLAEAIALKFGLNRIAQIKFTQKTYMDLMPPWKAAFEGGTTFLPKDAETVADHRSIRLVRGVAEIVREGKNKNGKKTQRHGDSAVAHLLAYSASGMDIVEYSYQRVGDSEDETDDDEADLRGFQAGAF